MNRHIKLFDLIAPFYNLFFKLQIKNYCQTINKNLNEHPLPDGGKVLDLGAGTGAFGYCWQEAGFDVIALEGSERMSNKCSKHGLKCINTDLTGGLPFAENSFDLVVAAYLAHGLQESERKILYREAKRVASSFVIFHDYGQNKYTLIKLIEFLEGGDYFNFINKIPGEMEKIFPEVEVLDTGPWHNWYVCATKEEISLYD
ncbi:MAG: class I SAM-dependent methyltransferase [Halanaerobiales bacterium]